MCVCVCIYIYMYIYINIYLFNPYPGDGSTGQGLTLTPPGEEKSSDFSVQHGPPRPMDLREKKMACPYVLNRYLRIPVTHPYEYK